MISEQVKPSDLSALSNEQTTSRELGSLSTYWLIFAVSLILLALLPEQAQWISTKRGWYTQPMLAPAIGLTVMLLFSTVKLSMVFRLKQLAGFNPIDSMIGAISQYRVALLSGATFLLYINTLSLIGFAPATLLFVLTLLLLSRLLNGFWIVASVLTVAALVFVFRYVVNFWLPDVWLYGLLPDDIADFANQYL